MPADNSKRVSEAPAAGIVTLEEEAETKLLSRGTVEDPATAL